MTEDILDRAIKFAVDAHAGQLRKDGAPYIFHPIEDATIVSTMTLDRELLAAAVLHDTVEDTDTTPEDIIENFGERVCALVMHETENKRRELPPEQTWRIRKEESLAALKDSGKEVKMLWLGDKLSNMRTLARNYATQGDDFFKKFNNPSPRDHKWYYGTILEMLRGDLGEYPAFVEYEALYHTVFDKFD